LRLRINTGKVPEQIVRPELRRIAQAAAGLAVAPVSAKTFTQFLPPCFAL
jgi:hypothetical protein